MRDILFRGMTIKGDWVYGLLSISQGKGSQPEKGHYISNPSGMPWAFSVRPETVGQYIGIEDIKAKKIFDGDNVLSQKFTDKPFSEKRKMKRIEGTVEYKVSTGKFNKKRIESYSAGWSVKWGDRGIYQCSTWGDFFDCEIIGNKHEAN